MAGQQDKGSPPHGRPKEGSALQAAPSRDATPLRSVHPRAGGDGAADLSPLGGKARSAKGAPINGSTADAGIMGDRMADAGMMKEAVPGPDIVHQYMGRSGS